MSVHTINKKGQRVQCPPKIVSQGDQAVAAWCDKQGAPKGEPKIENEGAIAPAEQESKGGDG